MFDNVMTFIRKGLHIFFFIYSSSIYIPPQQLSTWTGISLSIFNINIFSIFNSTTMRTTICRFGILVRNIYLCYLTIFYILDEHEPQGSCRKHLETLFYGSNFQGGPNQHCHLQGGMNHQTQMAEILAASVNDINDKSCNSVLDDHHC